MPLVLIVEDTAADLRKAADAARRAGFTEFEVSAYATNAQSYLERALDGAVPLPDAMIVDLELGLESGYELLRFWHKNPRLRAIPVVVCTIMGEHERKICGLFGVKWFISKKGGYEALVSALSNILEGDAWGDIQTKA
jgi:CheY-like chemotaxis protein